MVRVGFIVVSTLGFISLIVGIGLITAAVILPIDNPFGFLSVLASIPCLFIGVALLFLGGAYLSFAICRKFYRTCKRSLAMSGLALCSISAIAGLLWSLGH